MDNNLVTTEDQLANLSDLQRTELEALRKDNAELNVEVNKLAAKLTAACAKVGELTLENDGLGLQLAESWKPKTDTDCENDQLWMALAYWACSCMDAAQKQVEVFVDVNDHGVDCEYTRAFQAIKEASK